MYFSTFDSVGCVRSVLFVECNGYRYRVCVVRMFRQSRMPAYAVVCSFSLLLFTLLVRATPHNCCCWCRSSSPYGHSTSMSVSSGNLFSIQLYTLYFNHKYLCVACKQLFNTIHDPYKLCRCVHSLAAVDPCLLPFHCYN